MLTTLRLLQAVSPLRLDDQLLQSDDLHPTNKPSLMSIAIRRPRKQKCTYTAATSTSLSLPLPRHHLQKFTSKALCPVATSKEVTALLVHSRDRGYGPGCY